MGSWSNAKRLNLSTLYAARHITSYVSHLPSPSFSFSPLAQTVAATSTPNPLNNLLRPASLNNRLLHLLILIKSPPSIQINRRSIHPLPIPVVDLRPNVQNQHRNNRAVHREKVLSRNFLAQRPHGKVEFGDDEDNAPRQAPVGAPGPGPGFPGEVVHGAALDFPRVAHADVGEADHAPAEEREEGGEVGEPAEDFGAAWEGC
jgi:hypothetical protein